MKSDVKIQINSLEALERLIGNDTALELELRNSVVQTFANKHFGVVVKDQHFVKELTKTKEAVTKSIAVELEKEIGEIKGRGFNYSTVTLNPEVQTAIRSMADRVVGEYARDYTESDEFKQVMRDRLDYYSEDKIRREVKLRFEAAMKKLGKLTNPGK